MIRRLSFLALLCLIACAETVTEVPGTITLDGDTYQTTLRTFQRDDGSTFQRLVVRDGIVTAHCRPDDPLDCRQALRNARRPDIER